MPPTHPNRIAPLLADVDLAELVKLWPSLPPTVRAQLVARAREEAGKAAGR